MSHRSPEEIVAGLVDLTEGGDVVIVWEADDGCRYVNVYRNRGSWLMESTRGLYQFPTSDLLVRAIDDKLHGRAVQGSEI